MQEDKDVGSSPNKEEAERITADILEGLNQKRDRWDSIYKGLAKVKAKNLFEPLGFANFTSYLKYLADEIGCQISYIWRIWNAGTYYDEIAKSQEGNELKRTLESRQQTIGDEVLTEVKKIAGKNPEKAVAILEKFADGEITKADIKNIWKAEKRNRKKKEYTANVTEPKASAESNHPDVKASDILLALSADVFDLYGKWKEKSGKPYFHLPRGHRTVYEILPEFSVRVPGADHKRRIDAMVFTNLDAGIFGADQDDLTLRCIEIKVSKSDLANDHKMGDYAPFAHYCYLAVPDYMEEFSKDYLLDNWGLLVYDPKKKHLKEVIPAKYEDSPPMSHVAVKTLAVKKLRLKTFYNR